MKILVFLLFFAVFVSAQSSEAILGEFSRQFRAPKNSIEFQNVLSNFQKVSDHNLRFQAGFVGFNQSLNEFSLLSLEEIAKFKLGALAEDPNVERPVVNLTFFGRQGRAITPPKKGFVWPEKITGNVKSQGNCGEKVFFFGLCESVHGLSDHA